MQGIPFMPAPPEGSPNPLMDVVSRIKTPPRPATPPPPPPPQQAAPPPPPDPNSQPISPGGIPVGLASRIQVLYKADQMQNHGAPGQPQGGPKNLAQGWGGGKVQ